jgi:hypothetical protein
MGPLKLFFLLQPDDVAKHDLTNVHDDLMFLLQAK